MGLKKLLIPLMVLLLASSAFATVTVTVVNPAGQTFFPVTLNQRFMDINFTVVDDNSLNPIHTTTIQFNPGGGDVNIVVAQDVNLSSTNCTFTTAQVWTAPGASCQIRYTFPRTGTTLPTATFVLDVNVTAITTASNNDAEGTGLATFSINNRLVSVNVLNILALATLILAAIFVIFAALFIGGFVDGQTIVLIAITGIVAVIMIILISEILLILTP